MSTFVLFALITLLRVNNGQSNPLLACVADDFEETNTFFEFLLDSLLSDPISSVNVDNMNNWIDTSTPFGQGFMWTARDDENNLIEERNITKKKQRWKTHKHSKN